MLMDFNESPLPPPPEVIDAVSACLSRRVNVYPAYGDFLRILAEYAGAPVESLMLTNGSDQGIDIILRSFLEDADELAMVQPGFAMFRQVAQTLGARISGPVFPETMEFPIEALKQSVGPKTRLMVVINPNNPTGTAVSLETLEDLLQEFRRLPVLVDEAYFEFNGVSSVPMMKHHANLIVLRTFSKAFALPGLRLGYVIAHPELVRQFQKIRGPYDVNIASVAAARAQLKNRHGWEFIVRHLMREVKPAVEEFFRKMEVRFYPSSANFMLVEPGNARAAADFLERNGILVRPMSPPLEHTFRLSLRMMPEMERFMKIFTRFLQSESASPA